MSKPKGWSDKDFRPASFRGVRFTAQVVEHGGGRRVVEHEVVDAAGWGEDTGRQLRTFTVNAVVAGDKYLAASRKLDDALDLPGAGAFVHPFLGTLSVNVLSWKARFGGRLGAIEYSLEIRESGQPLAMLPVEAPDAKSWADKFSDACADFADEVLGPVQQTLDSAAAAVDDVSEAVNAVNDAFRKITDPALVGKVLQAGMNLAASTAGLLKAPGDIARGWAAMVGSLVDGVKRLGPGRGADASDACVAACNAIPDPPANPATPIEKNAFVLNAVARASLASGACQCLVESLAAGNGPSTFDDVTTKAAAATDLLARVARQADSPALWRAAMDLRDATGRIAGDAALALPHLRSWTPPRAMSVLEVCQRLYGDAARVEEVVARNGLDCSLRVAGTLRVIAEAA